MRLIHTLLELRRKEPELFAQGDYVPLKISGAQAERFVAFTRTAGERRLLVVASILEGENEEDADFAKISEGAMLSLPEGGRTWTEVCTGRELPPGEAERPISEFFHQMPVSIFIA